MKLLNEPNGNKINYSELEYCFNCDSEAVCYVDWKGTLSGEIHRSFMCQTCRNAFELGRGTHEPVVSIKPFLLIKEK